MKSPFFFLGILLVFNMACKSVKKTENGGAMKDDSFTLLSATAQPWTAGVPSGGKGTEYYFKIKINTSKELTFDSAWINNQSYAIFLSKDNGAISTHPLTFVKGDSITLRISDLTNPNTKALPSKPPMSYDGAALIGYKVKGRSFYYIIKEIQKLPPSNRQ
jgi:hypothetical protein